MWWDSDASLTSPLSQQVLQWLQSCGNSVVMGWGPSEIGVVQALAQHGVAIHASDWAVNIATYASFYVPVLQQRRRRARAPAKAAHTVTFLLSDGDNLQVRSCNSTCIMHASLLTRPPQWLVGGNFASPSNDWWGSSTRGVVPMGWTISPALAEVAPSILQRYYREASCSDAFVAGPSGAAYTFPDAIANASEFASWSMQYMQRSDLQIVNVIATSDCDADCAAPYVRAGAHAVFLYTYGCVPVCRRLTACCALN